MRPPSARPAHAAAIVTGGSRGIGAAIVRHLAAAGRVVVNLDREPPAGPSPARHIAADLADPTATAAALAQIVAEHAPLWLVNNVGMVAPATLDETSLASFDQVVALNLRAAVQCAQACLPAMRAARFGRIVNVSSRAALGKELRTAYAATKAGLLGLTRTWALELGRDGVTVNAVAPGPIATELFHAANPPGAPRTQAIVDAVPVGRIGAPEDVAHAVGFLLADEAGFITGQTLYVCGGMTVGAAGA